MIPSIIRTAGAALILLTVSPHGLPAGGQPGPRPPEITVTGRIRLVGNASSSRLVITDGEDQDWYLEGPDRERLSRLEQQTVTVRGSAEYRDIILANGQKAGVRRFLRNITLVNRPPPAGEPPSPRSRPPEP